jgi:SAM-dependent methyltransferase
MVMHTPALRLSITAALALSSALAVVDASAQSTYMEEVPFVTTPDNVTLEMLRVAKVGSGDHVIDLGSGDGRIVITAARRFGATGLGVEIVPDLVQKSIRTAREAGVADKAEFREQDLFKTDLSPASVITMYLLPDVNVALRPKLLELKPGTRVVSHDWDMGDWKPDQTTVVAVPDKAIGREKSSKVHLWTVPARIDGLWCGSGPLGDFSLKLGQKYQEVQGTLTRRNRVRELRGMMNGYTLEGQETRHGALAATLDGAALRITGGRGALSMLKGFAFSRAKGESCV